MTTAAPPQSAALLGYAGLLPAIALCVAVAVGPLDWQMAALHAHAVYAAVILSFIGGAWWGLASTRAAPQRLAGLLALSVVPSLAGWTLATIGGGSAMVGLGLLFGLVLPIDARLVRTNVAPAWWARLRVPLSSGMALLAIASGVAVLAAI